MTEQQENQEQKPIYVNANTHKKIKVEAAKQGITMAELVEKKFQ